MITFLTVLHILVCLFLILVVLLQAGKGGGMGIAFGGGGGSQTVFGSSGAGNFLTRLTSITAAIFLVTSLGLAHYSSQQDSRRLQRLAEKKDAEKKSDEDRATKLKQELEKARQSAQKPGAPVETVPAATPMSVPPAGGTDQKAPAPKTLPKMAPTAKTTVKVGDSKAEPANDSATKPTKPATKPAPRKRVVDPEGAAGKPSGDDKGEAAPRAPAAPPTAPAPAE